MPAAVLSIALGAFFFAQGCRASTSCGPVAVSPPHLVTAVAVAATPSAASSRSDVARHRRAASAICSSGVFAAVCSASEARQRDARLTACSGFPADSAVWCARNSTTSASCSISGWAPAGIGNQCRVAVRPTATDRSSVDHPHRVRAERECDDELLRRGHARRVEPLLHPSAPRQGRAARQEPRADGDRRGAVGAADTDRGLAIRSVEAGTEIIVAAVLLLSHLAWGNIVSVTAPFKMQFYRFASSGAPLTACWA